MIQQLWNWYIDLYKNDDPKVVVGTIAMTFAALSFVITYLLKPLYWVLKRKKAKVSIEAFHSFAAGETDLGLMVSDFSILTVLTNKSKQQIYINNPQLETRKNINGSKMHIVPAIQGTYPAILQAGQEHKRTYSANNNVFRLLKPTDKVRYVVTDTIGGKYYSKYYKVKDLQR